MNIKISIFIAICLLGIVSCYKSPSYPNTPAIEFDRLETISDVYTLGEEGNLYLKFTDGDGDIGLIPGGDSNSILTYKNTSTDTFFKQSYFNIPFVPKNGTENAISGTIKVKFKDALFSAYNLYFLFKGKTIDTFSFKMKITDRAGNVSNEITTPPIVVKMP
ncbi:MAG: hypothetical protein JWN78_698 [Bacteroidota bacterium]|nr:hypothetical protein [Bacteroidota bacterium]